MRYLSPNLDRRIPSPMVSLLFASVVAACLESTSYGVFLILSLAVLYLWIRQHDFNGPGSRWGALIWDLRKSPLIIVNLFFVVIVSVVRAHLASH